MNIDLDQARAEREPASVQFAGKSYEVKGLPLLAVIAGQQGRVEEAVSLLFGDDADALMADGFTVEDLETLLNGLTGGLGNVPTSTGS